MSDDLPDITGEEAILAAATDASPDTEADLARLYELAAYLRVDPALKKEYEELRNKLVRRLGEDGPRIFVDAEGHKHIGYPTRPVNTVLDLDVAQSMRRRRGVRAISAETLDLIAPRKQNLEGLKMAKARGWITEDQLLELTTETPGTGYVSWIELDGEGEAEPE